MLSRLMASSERTGVFGSWLSAQARNCRAHSWGLVFCRCAMETGGTCWSATSSIHSSRLKPRACAWALKAASFSAGRLSVTVMIATLRLQVNAPRAVFAVAPSKIVELPGAEAVLVLGHV